ncbi:hypothetical protein Mal52_45270 [Symmachiella dynata]|uniref:Uncharacterized protein n=1 Tax=Symmachiella dynata TaxID=2527995 RepID=A0A517ZU99_9PLAN|nr:hypothetical protein Mal52_45270 [Symmachiella dynata]
MFNPQCPTCYSELETRAVAPCFMCGDSESGIEHLTDGRHEYAVYRFPNGTEMVLCEICYLDIGAFCGETWGFPSDQRLSCNDLFLVRQIYDPVVVKDGYCSKCQARLAYLRALREIIEANSSREQ